MLIPINTKLFFILVKDAKGENVVKYLNDRYDAYIDDDEYIVFRNPKYYTMFQLQYNISTV